MAFQNQRHLQLTTQWNNHNRSQSSITSTSETTTFHSALDNGSHIELEELTHTACHATQSSSSPQTHPSQNLCLVKISSQDSGYPETTNPQTPLSALPPRLDSPSTSSARRSSPSKLERHPQSTTWLASRPSTKSATRSSLHNALIRQSSLGRTPCLQTWHTTSCHYPHPPTIYQFVQFCSLADNAQTDQNSDTRASPTPPATVQYWTSDSTRRLEYAAIDAGSKGVKGFLVKLAPDCILPKTSRSKERSRFCYGDEGSEAGSVRRYRLALPEEKDCSSASAEETWKRPATGVLRRWTRLFRRKIS